MNYVPAEEGRLENMGLCLIAAKPEPRLLYREPHLSNMESLALIGNFHRVNAQLVAEITEALHITSKEITYETILSQHREPTHPLHKQPRESTGYGEEDYQGPSGPH